MEIKRHPKDRGFGYKKAYDYEESIKKDIEPTEKDWQELKEKLPEWIAEAFLFGVGMAVAITIAGTILYYLLTIIYSI